MADSTTFTTTTASEVAVIQESVYVSLTTYTTTNPSIPWTTVPTTDENGSSYALIYVEASTALTTETLSSVSLSTRTYYGVLPTTSISRITTTVTSHPLATKSASATNAANTPVHLSRGLSTGAKAGIGVGVTLGFLSLAAITVCAIARTRRVRRIKTPGKQTNQDPFHKHELDSSADLSRMGDAVELEGSAMAPITVIGRKAVGITNNAPTVVDGKEVVLEK